MELLYECLRLFLLSLAVSFWPFIFLMMLVIGNAWALGEYTHLGDSVKKRKTKNKKIQVYSDDLPTNVDISGYDNEPIVETSFGDQRIGEVFTDGT